MAGRPSDPEAAKAREQEAKRLAALRESDPEAYKAERLRIRQENFKRVATRRVNAALKALDMVKPIANRNNYEYTDEQAEAILNALNDELEKVMRAFQPQSATDGPKFSL